MREEIQRWHSIVLQTYSALMHESLIYPHNIITVGSKSLTFEDKEGLEFPDPMRGFMAMKDIGGRKTKFFLEEEYYPDLPIRVNKSEEIFYKDSARSKSVVLRPTDITPFSIKAESCWESNKDFIDSIAPFKHSEPDQWTLNKLIAIVSYVGKTFCGICSLSEFGKSSIYLILDSITKKCPVFQPRSVPGVLAQITSDGNMVFDEVHDAPGDVKKCMENFSLQVAGNSPVYINGAMRSKNTLPKYDVSKQSITYLYNVYSNYKDPSKQFWNNIWSNTKAMESRFLCLKLDGKLEEEFDKNFNISKVAEDNKLFYIKIAKHLLYLKDLKFKNAYEKRYQQEHQLSLTGRHKILYEEITWMIDIYADSQEMYDKFVQLLNKAIIKYTDMLINDPQMPWQTKITENIPQQEIVVEEEVIDSKTDSIDIKVDSKSPEMRVLETVDKYVKVPIEQLLEETGVDENLIKRMITTGAIFEVRPGVIARL